MLVDVHFRSDPVLAMVALIGVGNGPVNPERIDQGLYLAGHWNCGDLVRGVRDRWLEDEYEPLDFPTSGVCDTPEQARQFLKLEDRPEKFFVTFVRISRADQPHTGGWRWHKWGEYIGEKEPQCEYLHDEPDIEEVYTFSVHELSD